MATSGSVLAVVSISLCYESLKWFLNPWFAISCFCKLVWDVLINACEDALFEKGPKIIHTACQSHVLDTVMDRSHVVVEAALVSFVVEGLTWLIRGMITSSGRCTNTTLSDDSVCCFKANIYTIY